MRIVGVFRKSLLEQVRGVWLLLLTLIIASFFVILYWLITGGGSTTYGVLVINHDIGADAGRGEQAIGALQDLAYANGQRMLKVVRVADRAAEEEKLRNREAAALVVIPRDFSRAIAAGGRDAAPITATVLFSGDLTNPGYAMVSMVAIAAVDNFVQKTNSRP